MKLYLDLDGVLADFDKAVRDVTGRGPDQQLPSAMWRSLAKHKDFFGSLDLMEDALELWEFCRPHRPVILTGLPLGTWAAPQKRGWVARQFGPDVEVITCMARDKHRFGGPQTVLVDDRDKARAPWEAAGGDFVLHHSASRSIEDLRDLGFQPLHQRF